VGKIGDAVLILVAHLPRAQAAQGHHRRSKADLKGISYGTSASAARRISRGNCSTCAPGRSSCTSPTRAAGRRWPTRWAATSPSSTRPSPAPTRT
jgi:hypothetical protein